jgi:hypothetical protein
MDNAERASSHSTTWLTVADATPAPRCVRWRAQGPRCLDAPIDSELRLLAAVRWSIREHGGEPSSRQVDELLDERA